jgi:hypothetical protein
VEAQGNLDQSLAQYRKDLAGLGELLEEAQMLPQVKAVPAP